MGLAKELFWMLFDFQAVLSAVILGGLMLTQKPRFSIVVFMFFAAWCAIIWMTSVDVDAANGVYNAIYGDPDAPSHMVYYLDDKPLKLHLAALRMTACVILAITVRFGGAPILSLYRRLRPR